MKNFIEYNWNFLLLFFATLFWFLFAIKRYVHVRVSDPSLLEMCMFLAGAFIFGYLLSNLKTCQQKPERKISEKLNPVLLSVKDNLKVVEGIGPAIEKVLNEVGINTYSDLAFSTEDKLRNILEAKGSLFQYHNPKTWPEQAALLRDGRFEEFKILEKELKGGIRV